MSPPARCFAHMVYDTVRHEFVLFGGGAANTGDRSHSDTWTFDGTSWSVHLVGASPPAAGESSAMAFDPVRGEAVLVVTHVIQGSPPPQTWTWNGQRWAARQPVHQPGAVAWPGIASWDTSSATVVLVVTHWPQGYGAPAATTLWHWNGSDWTSAPNSGPAPAGVAGSAFSSGGRGTLVALDFDGSTWLWGEAPPPSGWQRISTAHSMGPRDFVTMTVAPDGTDLLAFGGKSDDPGGDGVIDIWFAI
jgi:hypothetical protein